MAENYWDYLNPETELGKKWIASKKDLFVRVGKRCAAVREELKRQERELNVNS